MAAYSPPKFVLDAGKSNVGAMFHRRVPAHPDHLALIDHDRTRSYSELDETSSRLANGLIALGLKPGDRIGLLARNCLEYVEVELAAAKAGFIVACLNWRLGAREMQHCIRLVEPAVVIAQAELVSLLDRLDLPSHLRLVIGKDYESLVAKGSPFMPEAVIDPEDGLVILYTSGTTGLPKGALISHRAMLARAASYVSEFAIPIGDNFVAWAPYYHMVSTDQTIATLLRGGTVHIVDGFQPDRLIDILEAVSMRWFVLMPGTVAAFTEALRVRKARPKGLGLVGAMADLIPREEIAAVTRYLNVPYVNTFGSTETGLPPATGSTIPVGVAPTDMSKRQSAFCDIRLVDWEDMDVPNGQPGEIAFRGPTLFSGYWNADEANARDFRGGWFHMGDILRRNPGGQLDFVDRVKYLIKSGGENIYPAEIEQVLLQDDRIRVAVVVRRSDEKWGEVPVVFIVRGDDKLSEQDVLERCHQELPSYKRPKAVFFIDDPDLPRSTTGKIQRHELEARLQHQSASQ